MNHRDLAVWIIVALAVGLSVYLLFYIHTESYQCLANPSAYAIRTFESSINQTIQCSCASFSRGNAVTFLLDNHGVHPNN